MAEKETIMKLKVNLQCDKCYEKVNKVLCKFPQIQDRAYLVKDNLVVIKVVCCNPEKIRDKICCKGCCVIKTIEIVEPPKPEKKKERPEKIKGPEKKKEEPGTKKEAEKPPTKPATPPPQPPVTVPPRPIPTGVCCGECYAGRPGGPCFQGHGTKPAILPVQLPVTVPPIGCPPPRPIPIGVCCGDCYAGGPGGPCFQGYGGPPICYDGYHGRPVYDSYGGPRPCYVSRTDQYFSEENASGCSIM